MMTPEERRAEFNRLFESIPAKKNTERIQRVCEILFCKPGTVRIWRMKNSPPRMISESSLKILQRGLQG